MQLLSMLLMALAFVTRYGDARDFGNWGTSEQANPLRRDLQEANAATTAEINSPSPSSVPAGTSEASAESKAPAPVLDGSNGEEQGSKAGSIPAHLMVCGSSGDELCCGTGTVYAASEKKCVAESAACGDGTQRDRATNKCVPTFEGVIDACEEARGSEWGWTCQREARPCEEEDSPSPSSSML